MDEHFYNNEFEKFLQQQVKQHRMYPSDAVWKGIYKQVHGHRRWPGLYFIAILLVAALTVCTVLIDSTPVAPSRIAMVKTAAGNEDHLDPAELTHETVTNIRNRQQQGTGAAIVTASLPVNATDEETPAGSYPLTVVRDVAHNSELVASRIELPAVETQQPAINTQALTGDISQVRLQKGVTATGEKNIDPNLLQRLALGTLGTNNTHDIASAKKKLSASRSSRWQYQFYVAPSSSYRQIVDQKPSEAPFNGPVATNYGVNASRVIRYKPGMGIELGIGVLYAITEKLRIKAGVQYNVRQYNIEAYAGNYEMAKIALVRRGAIDSMKVVSQYRSNNGYSEALLLNKYQQVSIPVGIEYALVNSSKVRVNLAGSLQPTYTFSPSAYLLATDYKSYVDGTSMIRNWNLNSSLEATFSYKVGDFQWKLGPQIRYQHLPTYSDPYPIKEYLIDYGFKIGFTKTIK